MPSGVTPEPDDSSVPVVLPLATVVAVAVVVVDEEDILERRRKQVFVGAQDLE